ncbi:hypothetical protein A3F06_04185 [candidate division TM6 bacterium RIFCSPHIGHO2_12_FULL_36_22]|nr:MAG: hypothetical protein A3F06_04185 [candidate division TM6 bacterium RIFCSPHIGHO2_12_FULL_36_22]
MNKLLLSTAIATTLISSIYADGLTVTAAAKARSVASTVLVYATKPVVYLGKPVVNYANEYVVNPVLSQAKATHAKVASFGISAKDKAVPVIKSKYTIAALGLATVGYAAYKVNKDGFDKTIQSIKDLTAKVAASRKTWASLLLTAAGAGAYYNLK